MWKATLLIPQTLTCILFQSTPSVWKATGFQSNSTGSWFNFNPRLPCGRRLCCHFRVFWQWNFNPRLPCGRRRHQQEYYHPIQIFQSTPSVWKATCASLMAFNVPSPFQSTPSVWKATFSNCIYNCVVKWFQSTPSVWKATMLSLKRLQSVKLFQSTPSVWKATCFTCGEVHTLQISIHAFRVEGDLNRFPTEVIVCISIHAFRVEGDTVVPLLRYPYTSISIHAFRVEGD